MGIIRTVYQGLRGDRDFKQYARSKGYNSVQQKPDDTYTVKASSEVNEVKRYAGAAVKASGGTKPRPTIQSLSRGQYRHRIGFFRP